MKELDEGKQALFSKPLPQGKVQCTACNHYCVLSEGEFGKCGVRKNAGGKLYSTVYGHTQTLTVDPIEKKPLFHFKPGSQCLSVSTFGCNFACDFCQNFEMSQEFSKENAEGPFGFLEPEKIVQEALERKAEGISYTYTEPTIFVEFALDIMKIARKKKLYNVWVSNGFMTEQVLEAVSPFLDAINVDKKGSREFYERLCKARLEPVLKNIEWLFRHKVHLELTYLIVPGFNDRKEQFGEAIDFVLSLSEKIPLHFSAFHPQFKLSYLPPTPAGKVLEAQKLALEKGVKYAYAGNLGMQEDSFCPECKSLLVKRQNYSTQIVGIKGKKCSKCGLDLSK